MHLQQAQSYQPAQSHFEAHGDLYIPYDHDWENGTDKVGQDRVYLQLVSPTLKDRQEQTVLTGLDVCQAIELFRVRTGTWPWIPECLDWLASQD